MNNSKSLFFRFTILLFFVANTYWLTAQNITISNLGEKGSHGRNWIISGENSIEISATENAVIHPSVIEYYLDKGINVSLVSKNGDIRLQSNITKHTNSGNTSLSIINLGKGAIVMSNTFEIKSNAFFYICNLKIIF
jgi:hypothetical protein